MIFNIVESEPTWIINGTLYSYCNSRLNIYFTKLINNHSTTKKYNGKLILSRMGNWNIIIKIASLFNHFIVQDFVSIKKIKIILFLEVFLLSSSPFNIKSIFPNNNKNLFKKLKFHLFLEFLKRTKTLKKSSFEKQ
jgi:hypothetical protein